MRRLSTAKQISEQFQLPLPRVYEAVRLELIPVVRIGNRQIRFDDEAVEKWIQAGGVRSRNENESKSAR